MWIAEHLLYAYRGGPRPWCCGAVVRGGVVSEAAPKIRDRVLGLPAGVAVRELQAIGATVEAWYPVTETSDFCEFGQLPKAMCAHCRAARVVTAVQPDFARLAEQAEEGEQETGPLIQARYGGRCRGCGGDILVGDFIAWSGGEGRYVCADCARQ
jgi:hypothetical protein